jgi:hypothetical protein
MILTDACPRPALGFETLFIQHLENLFAELPNGKATLSISRVPGHPEWPEPYFEIVPKNLAAARFAGSVVSTDLDLTIGDAAREFVGFARGGTILKGLSWQDELRHIWQAVTAGGFTQRHYLDSAGKVIGWSTKLIVYNRELIFRNGRRKERLFARENVRLVTYEPYG